MGNMHNQRMEREDNLSTATDYLVHLKLLRECSVHNEIFGGANGDLESYDWNLIERDLQLGENGPLASVADMQMNEMRALLESAHQLHSGTGCSRCTK